MEFYGKWALARMDVDEIPEIASSLKVVKIPAVFVINRGNAVTSYHGYPNDQELQSIFNDLLLLSGLQTDTELLRSMV
jgi:thioredoxin-like negative regulator of GroEL